MPTTLVQLEFLCCNIISYCNWDFLYRRNNRDSDDDSDSDFENVNVRKTEEFLFDQFQGNLNL